MFNRAAADRVAIAEGPVCVHKELGDDEQRNTLHIVGRADDLGEDEVDDVLGEIMFARRNEYLGARDLVAAVCLRLGLGLDQAKVGAAMRLSQVHRARPGAGDHLRHIGGLQLVRPFDQQRRDRARRQAVVHFKRLVGRQNIFADCGREDLGKPLPAIFLGCAERGPAAFAKLLVGVLEPGRRGDRAIVVTGAAFLVADAIERGQHLGGEAPAFLEDRFDNVGRCVGEGRQIIVAAKLDDMIEDELRVADGGGINGHGA